MLPLGRLQDGGWEFLTAAVRRHRRLAQGLRQQKFLLEAQSPESSCQQGRAP